MPAQGSNLVPVHVRFREVAWQSGSRESGVPVISQGFNQPSQ